MILPRLKPSLFVVFLLSFLAMTSCGNHESVITNPDDKIIFILDGAFVPDSVDVAPGDEVFFLNEDSVAHQILSQSAENQFDNTGAFDSFIIVPNQVGVIVIPEDAAPGTTFFFYDDILSDQMVTPNGSLVVE